MRPRETVEGAWAARAHAAAAAAAAGIKLRIRTDSDRIIIVIFCFVLSSRMRVCSSRLEGDLISLGIKIVIIFSTTHPKIAVRESPSFLENALPSLTDMIYRTTLEYVIFSQTSYTIIYPSCFRR